MMDGERSRGTQPGAVHGPPLYRRMRGDLEMSTSRPLYLLRLEEAIRQPPVRMPWWERALRFMTRR